VSGHAEEKYLSKRELSNRKVLVVEDEMMIAMLIEDILGHRIRMTSSKSRPTRLGISPNTGNAVGLTA
jgi:hypothetical protein